MITVQLVARVLGGYGSNSAEGANMFDEDQDFVK